MRSVSCDTPVKSQGPPWPEKEPLIRGSGLAFFLNTGRGESCGMVVVKERWIARGSIVDERILEWMGGPKLHKYSSA